MPPIGLTGDIGAQFDFIGNLTIADVNHFVNFAKVPLTDPSFVWEILGDDLTGTYDFESDP